MPASLPSLDSTSPLSEIFYLTLCYLLIDLSQQIIHPINFREYPFFFSLFLPCECQSPGLASHSPTDESQTSILAFAPLWSQFLFSHRLSCCSTLSMSLHSISTVTKPSPASTLRFAIPIVIGNEFYTRI